MKAYYIINTEVVLELVITMPLFKYLIARPILAIVGVLALIGLFFNYQKLGIVYGVIKYLVLFGIGLYAYYEIEKRIGRKMSVVTRTIVAVLSAIVLMYVLRQVFFLAFLIVILYFLFKGD
jgi:hypothetical protein